MASGIDARMPTAVEPVRTTPAYRLALGLVAVALVVIPGIYLALVGAVVWFTARWAATQHVLVTDLGSARAGLFLYAVPILVGLIVCYAFVVPLFARRPPRAEAPELRREDAPQLMALVERIADSMGAPRPALYTLDQAVNASASLRPGLSGLLLGQLELRIGLPLVAGMSVQHLGGVIAHELGHFAQGAGMRLQVFIHRTMAWMARLASPPSDPHVERDFGNSVIVAVAVMASDLVIGLSRYVWRALFHLALLVSSYCLRQMEFDADRWSVRFVGSDGFEPSFRRISELALAEAKARMTLGSAWQQGKLADDYSALVVAHAGALALAERSAVERELREGRTQRFDTHPAIPERVANAQREGKRGVLASAGGAPASSLFRNFAALSEQQSASLYRERLGPGAGTAQLVPAAGLVETATRELKAAQSCSDYLGAHPLFEATIAGAALRAPAHAGASEPARDISVETLAKARAEVAAGSSQHGELTVKVRALQQQLGAVMRMRALLSVGIPLPDGAFGLPPMDRSEAESEVGRIKGDVAKGLARLVELQRPGVTRLRVALALARAHEDRAEPGVTVARRIAQAVATLDKLAAVAPQLDALADPVDVAAALAMAMARRGASSAGGGANTAAFTQRSQWANRRIGELLGEIRAALGGHPNPLEGESGAPTLAAYLLGPESLPPVERGVRALQRSWSLYERTLGDLVEIAQAVEARVLGA